MASLQRLVDSNPADESKLKHSQSLQKTMKSLDIRIVRVKRGVSIGRSDDSKDKVDDTLSASMVNRSQSHSGIKLTKLQQLRRKLTVIKHSAS